VYIKFESLYDLKRLIYLWVVPFIIIAILINSLTTNVNTTTITINSILIFWFTLSLILIYHNCFVRFAEYSNLILISLIHVFTVYDMIHHNLATGNAESLGDFIVWTPLYLMFIFLTLGKKQGTYFSIGIFVITLMFGIIDFKLLSGEAIDSITQFYFANIVYIVVLFYAQHIFQGYAQWSIVKKHAYVDSLTGIANRLRIDEELGKKLLEATHLGTPFSIIFFDIDYFKKVNDQFGHKIGDGVLKEFSDLINENLNNGSLFGRWGGEEFIIILNGTLEEAESMANLLRKKIEDHLFQHVGQITASFGVTESKPFDDIDRLLCRVDKGLYKSKDSGRNRVNRG
jgi:diguanylate cyclase (GGDEF)-like protein